MNSIKYESRKEKDLVFYKNLPMGQAFRAIFSRVEPELFLKTYSGMISLDDPNRTWDTLCSNSLKFKECELMDLEIIARPS